MGRPGRVAAGCATLVALTAGGTAADPEPLAPTTTSRPYIPTPAEEDCVDRPWQPDNPPFVGPGPHLVAPVAVKSHLPRDIAVDASGNFQPYWGEDTSVLVNDAGYLSQVQLLACVAPVKGGGPIGEMTCHFDDSSGPVPTREVTFPPYEASYEVTVREARTGRVVTTLTVPGALDGSQSCPGFAVDTGHTLLLRALDRNLLSDELRPLSSAPDPSAAGLPHQCTHGGNT